MPDPDLRIPQRRQEIIDTLTDDDWAVIWFLTNGASPEIYEGHLRVVRERYGWEQPQAVWAKVQGIVTAPKDESASEGKQ